MKNRDPCKAMVRQFLLYLFMNSTHFPWPLRVRLKQPSLKFVISIKHMIRVILKWLKGRGMSVPVPRERVSPTLKHNCGGLVQLHHSGGKQASVSSNKLVIEGTWTQRGQKGPRRMCRQSRLSEGSSGCSTCLCQPQYL